MLGRIHHVKKAADSSTDSLGLIVHLCNMSDLPHAYKTRPLLRVVCQVEDDEARIAKAIRDSKAPDQADYEAADHRWCCRSVRTFDQILEPLLVCRQFHREAALYPYSLSTWAFEYVPDLGMATRRMVPAQLTSIFRLRLNIRSTVDHNQDTASHIQKFSGLQRLFIFAQMSDYNTRIAGITEQDNMFQPILAFGDLPKLRSVSVTIYPNQQEMRDKPGTSVLSLGRSKEWSIRTENKMLMRRSRSGDEEGEEEQESQHDERPAKRPRLV